MIKVIEMKRPNRPLNSSDIERIKKICETASYKRDKIVKLAEDIESMYTGLRWMNYLGPDSLSQLSFDESADLNEYYETIRDIFENIKGVLE